MRLRMAFARGVLLAVTLAGVVAMHGLAATDSTGGHHSPIPALTDSASRPGAEDSGGHRDVVDVPGHAVPDPTAPQSAVDPVATPMRTPAAGSAVDAWGEGHPDHIAAGCLAVLLGLIDGAVLRSLAGATGPHGSLPATGRLAAGGAAPAPPQPIFLSLCVFRI